MTTRTTKHSIAFMVFMLTAFLLAITSINAKSAPQSFPTVPPFLAKDVLPYTSGSSDPDVPMVVGDKLFFEADDQIHHRELWVSDGTEVGTKLVKDIVPHGDSNSTNLTDVNGTLFYTVYETTYGTEIWKSDGTEAGTMLVKDIYPGPFTPFNGTPEYLTASNGILLFSAYDDGPTDRELWRSDGTEAGTFLVKDINPNGPSRPYSLTDVNGTLYFAASDGVNGSELWRSDGTEAGTTLVKDIYPGSDGSIYGLAKTANDILFIIADDGSGQGLWISDGTEAGTVPIKDAASLPGDPRELTAVDNTLYFMAGIELWRSDGTAGGTVKVKELVYNLEWFTAVNGILYFVDGDTLWKSDGTGAGTIPLTSFDWIRHLTDVDGTLFFVAKDATSGKEVWKSDGTIAGTVLVKDIHPFPDGSPNFYDGPVSLVSYNGRLFFSADDGYAGQELWSTDGSEAGTVMVKEIAARGNSGRAEYLTELNGTAYYIAWDNEALKPWQSDGTPDGTFVADYLYQADFSLVNTLTTFSNMLFYVTKNPNGNMELWRSDGTIPGTLLVTTLATSSTNSSFTLYFDANNVLFVQSRNFNTDSYTFWGTDGTPSNTVELKTISDEKFPNAVVVGDELHFFEYTSGVGYALWRSDGTLAGTTKVLDLGQQVSQHSPAAMNGVSYFAADPSNIGVYRLWRSDGTEIGTHEVANSPVLNTNPSFHIFNDVLYYPGYDESSGRELWRTDNTGSGATMLKEINSGINDANPQILGNLSNVFLFCADDGTHGSELWGSDGTEAGTTLVKDISATNQYCSFRTSYSTVSNDLFIFQADDGIHGQEPWRSDGTEAGTFMLTDIRPGIDSSSATNYINMGGTVFFEVHTDVELDDVWMSDGTTAGTMLATAVYPNGAPLPSRDENIITIGDNIFAEAYDFEHGSELWVFPQSTAWVQSSTYEVAVEEGGATAVYTLTLTEQPTDGVTIELTTDGQLSVAPTTLTFTDQNWDQPQNVTVTAVDDSQIEGIHSSQISHTVTSNDPAYNGLPLNNVAVTISDNDHNLFLPIITLGNSAVQLNWPTVTNVNRYVYRSDDPYFSSVTRFDTTTNLSWEDDQALGTGNHFYGVTAVTQSGYEIQSKHIGQLEFELSTP